MKRRTFSLRTFGWLCARQAAYQVLAPYGTEAGRDWLRVMLCKVPLAQVRRMTQSAIGRNPYRES